MSEDQWWRCNDWRPMYDFLAGRMTQRKVQLYVCAGLRLNLNLLYDDSSRKAVEIMERHVDGLATAEEHSYASWCAECPTFGYDFALNHIRENLEMPWYRERVVNRLIELGVFTEEEIQSGICDEYGRIGNPERRNRVENSAHIAYHATYNIDNEGRICEHLIDHITSEPEWPGGWLMREMFGNPFHPITVKPEWLKWSGGTVSALAQMIYDERAYDRMPILADALQDAGCDNLAMITHCRKGGRHVRGCWVIDALLGKLRFNPPTPLQRETP